MLYKTPKLTEQTDADIVENWKLFYSLADYDEILSVLETAQSALTSRLFFGYLIMLNECA
jgi:hypothetical protein